MTFGRDVFGVPLTNEGDIWDKDGRTWTRKDNRWILLPKGLSEATTEEPPAAPQA